MADLFGNPVLPVAYHIPVPLPVHYNDEIDKDTLPAVSATSPTAGIPNSDEQTTTKRTSANMNRHLKVHYFCYGKVSDSAYAQIWVSARPSPPSRSATGSGAPAHTSTASKTTSWVSGVVPREIRSRSRGVPRLRRAPTQSRTRMAQARAGGRGRGPEPATRREQKAREFEAAYRKLRRGLTAEIQRQIDAQTGIHPTSGAYSQHSAVPGHSQILTSPGKRKRQSSEVAGIQNEVQRLKALLAEVQTTPTTAEPVGTLATLPPPKSTYKDLSAAARVTFWTRRLNQDVIVSWYARFAGVVDVAATMRDPAMRLFLMDRMIRACDNVFNFVIGIELANEELRANADIQLRSSSGFDLETADFIQAFKDHSNDYKRRNPTAEIGKLEKIMVPAEIATRLDV